MSPTWLLDTNIASQFLKRLPSPHVLERVAREPRKEVAISIVTAMELRFGAAHAPDNLRLRQGVERVLGSLPVLPLPDNIDRVYAEVRADLERRGKPIGPLDTIIAAHALAIGATLVSSNLREFRRVTGLACEDWSVASR